MVGRCDNQAVAFVLLQKLQEGIQHAADFADVLAFAAPRADGVELVKEVNTARGLHSVEDQAKLGGGLTHELRDQPVQQVVNRGRCSSPANTAAVIVLPDPGGPTSNNLRRGWSPWSRKFCCCRCSLKTRLEAAANCVRRESCR